MGTQTNVTEVKDIQELHDWLEKHRDEDGVTQVFHVPNAIYGPQDTDPPFNGAVVELQIPENSGIYVHYGELPKDS